MAAMEMFSKKRNEIENNFNIKLDELHHQIKDISEILISSKTTALSTEQDQAAASLQQNFKYSCSKCDKAFNRKHECQNHQRCEHKEITL